MTSWKMEKNNLLYGRELTKSESCFLKLMATKTEIYHSFSTKECYPFYQLEKITFIITNKDYISALYESEVEFIDNILKGV